jgi:small-conductance mechanosensitive channel
MVEAKFKIGDKVRFAYDEFCGTITRIIKRSIIIKNPQGKEIEIPSFTYCVDYDENLKNVAIQEDYLSLCE